MRIISKPQPSGVLEEEKSNRKFEFHSVVYVERDIGG